MAKQSCLIVLSASSLGVSAPSFLQCYKLTQSAFNIEIATPEAAAAVFIDKDDQSTRWLNDIAAKKLLEPHSLSDIQGSQYSCVVIPHSPGASEDLATCEALGNILSQCLAEKKDGSLSCLLLVMSLMVVVVEVDTWNDVLEKMLETCLAMELVGRTMYLFSAVSSLGVLKMFNARRLQSLMK
ncbi:glutamine amidotransferase-like class 1 domain-containing protein 1 isoform X2 [Cherax quadricarinatus]|uniref:glutamine amidotransferase-like class 1 domain-containing protein 1 isoform X2 n=1 Tax=Cherax quadricarinatus TaxID=27406 RepID=UPI0023798DDA|nr:glutamine amidotransferase-like class 1 domain-containing protein 1 isoform X1 [Cherax quadricarinatus]